PPANKASSISGARRSASPISGVRCENRNALPVHGEPKRLRGRDAESGAVIGAPARFIPNRARRRFSDFRAITALPLRDNPSKKSHIFRNPLFLVKMRQHPLSSRTAKSGCQSRIIQDERNFFRNVARI